MCQPHRMCLSFQAGPLFEIASINETRKMSTENTTEQYPRLHEPNLCSRCQTVDCDDELVNMFPFQLSDIDPTCQSCASLKALLFKEGQFISDEFVLVARQTYPGIALRECSIYWPPKLAMLRDLDSRLDFDWPMGLLARRSEPFSTRSHNLPASVIKRADFRLIKSWITKCMSGICCKPGLCTPADSVPNQHVIDCLMKKVIPAPYKCEYAALSYVWGGNQATFGPGDTLDAIPKTIEDAIQVTQLMGIRYLWVDRYCILDNGQHKKEQIHSMDKIYSNARFTIVAAAGDSPDYGLPGVSDRHRRRKPWVRLGSRLMASTQSHPVDLICSSKWWTRGWTYQECMHSKRLLFFTEEQVYFQCRNYAALDSFYFSVSRLCPAARFGILQGLDVKSCINQYLKRELTFPSDILNAIISILQRFENENGRDRFRHLWGLPIQRALFLRRSWNEALSEALLWGFETPATRRKGFPSWSWTGWVGLECKYYDIKSRAGRVVPSRGNLPRDPEFMVKFRFSSFTSFELEDWPTCGNFNHKFPSSVLHVKANVVRLRLEPGASQSSLGTEGRLYALDAKGEPIYLSPVSIGSLFCQGSSGDCRLDKAVESAGAYHLGIFLTFTSHMSLCTDRKVDECGFYKPLPYEVVDEVFLLVVERKGDVFERVGVCCAAYDVLLRADIQVQTIRLG